MKYPPSWVENGWCTTDWNDIYHTHESTKNPTLGIRIAVTVLTSEVGVEGKEQEAKQ